MAKLRGAGGETSGQDIRGMGPGVMMGTQGPPCQCVGEHVAPCWRAQPTIGKRPPGGIPAFLDGVSPEEAQDMVATGAPLANHVGGHDADAVPPRDLSRQLPAPPVEQVRDGESLGAPPSQRSPIEGVILGHREVTVVLAEGCSEGDVAIRCVTTWAEGQV